MTSPHFHRPIRKQSPIFVFWFVICDYSNSGVTTIYSLTHARGVCIHKSRIRHHTNAPREKKTRRHTRFHIPLATELALFWVCCTLSTQNGFLLSPIYFWRRSRRHTPLSGTSIQFNSLFVFSFFFAMHLCKRNEGIYPRSQFSNLRNTLFDGSTTWPSTFSHNF